MEAVAAVWAVLALALWLSREHIDSANWWIAVGTWLYTLFTLGLVLVARNQLSALKDQLATEAEKTREQSSLLQQQIDQTQTSSQAQLKELERARRATSLPVLVFDAAALVVAPSEPNNGYMVEVSLRNVGPGAALHVEFVCWVVPVPPDVAEDMDALNAFQRQGNWGHTADNWIASLYLEAIAPGDVTSPCFRLRSGRLVFGRGEQAPIRALVFVRGTFEDIFGTEHPYPRGDDEEGTFRRIMRIAPQEKRLPTMMSQRI